jgi:hypothetical protein
MCLASQFVEMCESLLPQRKQSLGPDTWFSLFQKEWGLFPGPAVVWFLVPPKPDEYDVL